MIEKARFFLVPTVKEELLRLFFCFLGSVCPSVLWENGGIYAVIGQLPFEVF
ncbi:hypothetical protein COLO4_35395 [Corchorus olitorius]|uniref:Uncharacterized protein n=1 Tax=Corchorus olitorius TaxID=93759 RepID=A0A1R3GH62_9ROSI|nr:hypothetical protein COLO4_35395 [Corchorus olitorius]